MAINALVFNNEEEALAGADALNIYYGHVNPPRLGVLPHPTEENRFAVGDAMVTEADVIAAVDGNGLLNALYIYGALYFAGLGEHAPPPIITEPSATSWGAV
jgi:hypothetical protein